jgi:hypothetical protein
MRTHNAKLTRATERCFDLSMDARVKPEDQKEFLAIGKRLRGSLLNLLTAQFEKNTGAVLKANSKIDEVSRTLSSVTRVLKNTSQTIAQLGELVSILDDLLKVASSFV